jgi:hypothetical protein
MVNLSTRLNESLVYDRNAASPWETFMFERIEEQWCAIKSFHVKYFSATSNGIFRQTKMSLNLEKYSNI